MDVIASKVRVPVPRPLVITDLRVVTRGARIAALAFGSRPDDARALLLATRAPETSNTF
jgi:hypothetical protein